MRSYRLAFALLALALLSGAYLWFAIVFFLDDESGGRGLWADTASARLTIGIGYAGSVSTLLAGISALIATVMPNFRAARNSAVACSSFAAALLLLYTLRDGFG